MLNDDTPLDSGLTLGSSGRARELARYAIELDVASERLGRTLGALARGLSEVARTLDALGAAHLRGQAASLGEVARGLGDEMHECARLLEEIARS